MIRWDKKKNVWKSIFKDNNFILKSGNSGLKKEYKMLMFNISLEKRIKINLFKVFLNILKWS